MAYDMYGCESWTISKAEREGIEAFERRRWRKLLKVSWIEFITNKSVIEEIQTDCFLEGLIRQKLKYFGYMKR